MEIAKCNIAQSHRRLNEAHRLWHQSYENYFDPEGFRTNINATIQALRNITFALQNEKANIAQFGEWYSKWINVLSTDKIMKWLSDTRTEIVHKKDLEMNSYALVSVFNYQVILKSKMQAPIFISNSMLVDFLLKEKVIDKNMLQANLCCEIERKWRVKEFDEDILYLLSYAIGLLYKIVVEAHVNSGILLENCNVKDTIHTIDLTNNDIPKCMSLYDDMKSVVSLNDLSARSFTYKKTDMKPGNLKKKHRMLISNRAGSILDKDAYVAAEKLFAFALKLLQVDGHHVSILFYQHEDYSWEFAQIVFNDRIDKYVFWNDFSKKVKNEKIVSVIFISECWIGDMRILKETGKYPCDQEDRKEALTLDVIDHSLRHINYTTLFSRNIFGKVMISETLKTQNERYFDGFLAPVCRVWEDNNSQREEHTLP